MLETSVLCNARSLGTCSNATQFVFWDGFHPSEAANRVLAGDLLAQGLDLISWSSFHCSWKNLLLFSCHLLTYMLYMNVIRIHSCVKNLVSHARQLDFMFSPKTFTLPFSKDNYGCDECFVLVNSCSWILLEWKYVENLHFFVPRNVSSYGSSMYFPANKRKCFSLRWRFHHEICIGVNGIKDVFNCIYGHPFDKLL